MSVVETKGHWYKLYKYIYHQSSVSSGIDCLDICQALCCPREHMPGPRVGTFVIFLPFELEYIACVRQLNISSLVLNWSEVRVSAEETVSVPWTRYCPFIEGTRCTIYSDRPVDCRCFPMTVSRSARGLELQTSSKCPGYQNITDRFRCYVETIWEMLCPSIPEDWWSLLSEIKGGLAQ